MANPSKKRKLDGSSERDKDYTNTALLNHDEIPQCGGQGCPQHLGEGILNVNGNTHTGRDFNMPRFNNNITINPYVIPQTPADSSTIVNKEQHRQDLLESLKFEQMDARQLTIKRAHEKTCKWFLKTTQYIDWLDVNHFDNHGGLLWIKGKPGAGKSTLMKFVLSDFYRNSKEQGNVILSFFFNARGGELEKSTIGLYRSLLLQLLKQQPDLQRVLDSAIPGYIWDIESLTSLLEMAVCLMEASSIFCFIDALDECKEDEIRSMLSFLRATNDRIIGAGTRLYICLASRYYPHITVGKGLNFQLEGREEHREDMANYLGTELHIGIDELAGRIHSMLLDKASGIFMWVILVVDILNKEYDRGCAHHLEERLQDIPDDLHHLIHNILTRDHDDMAGLLLCIQWVLFAKRPLTPKELYFAIMSGVEQDRLFTCDSEQHPPIETIQRYILNNSKGLAELTKSETPTIQFIHESIPDFLLKEKGLQEIWPELEPNLRGKSHDKLRQCCLAYLSNKIVKNFDLPQPLPKASAPEAKSLREKTANKLPFLEYASQNVLYHADRAQSDEISQKDFLEAFVKALCPPSFSLDSWKLYNNLFEIHQIRRYTQEESLLYILAEHNLPNLIRIPNLHQGCFFVEKARYGPPIFAALAKQNNEATQALIQMQVRKLSPDSALRKLYDNLANTIQYKSRFSQGFIFKGDIVCYLIKNEEPVILDVFLATEKIDVNDSVRNNTKYFPHLSGKHSNRITPLMLAAKTGNTSIIQSLLNHGADPTKPWALEIAVEEKNETIVQLLLEKGADPNLEDLLRDAVGWGNKAIVRLLLEKGADPNLENLLRDAISGKNEAIVRLLLEKGADPNLGDLLGYAVGWENEAIVRLLLEKGADPKLGGSLSYAVRRGEEAMVRLLLEKGADFKLERFLTVPIRDDKEPMIRLLLEKGADPNLGSSLSYAVHRREEAIVRLLVEKGADVNHADIGEPPLQIAARKGYAAIVKFLLDEGACVEGRGAGDSPLLVAAGGGYEIIVELLLDYGADIERIDALKMTPLHRAVAFNNEDTVKMLLSKNANADGCSMTDSPIHAAVSRNFENIVRLLVEHGANVNSQSSYDGCTPLMRAAQTGSVGIVRYLLDSGTDATVRNDAGQGLLSIASELHWSSNGEVVQLLRDYGITS
ncbi:ankyrin repeat-containing domain protein [Annulohypoxylon moriforme]|nr:ankyrin repeat-containing domain protein [Annulohypoxylon moriforme]